MLWSTTVEELGYQVCGPPRPTIDHIARILVGQSPHVVKQGVCIVKIQGMISIFFGVALPRSLTTIKGKVVGFTPTSCISAAKILVEMLAGSISEHMPVLFYLTV